MQQINRPRRITRPFADAGGKNVVPESSQLPDSPGAASYTDGFPPQTRTPIAAGGIPPSGLDMNGVLFDATGAARWGAAGGGYVYDSVFANDANVGGYPAGARIQRADGLGYWLNTTDNNTTDPESIVVGEAATAGWVPDLTSGFALITMTNANVTLTPAQYGRPTIILSGTLTANLNLFFPNISGQWVVINNCTGSFSVTAKTSIGTGVQIDSGDNGFIFCDGINITSVRGKAGSSSLTQNGYRIFPSPGDSGDDDLIIQWGMASISTNPARVTFPIAFPNSCLCPIITDVGAITDSLIVKVHYPDGVTNAYVDFMGITPGGTALPIGVFYWFAIGH